MRRAGAIIPFLILLSSPAAASSLSVLPITVAVPQPASIGTLTLRNREARPLNAQIRVFRWTQIDGEDKLEPTSDVVASPPIVTISPGADYVVRLQRTASAEVTGEEAYRTVVDELPNPNRQHNGAIALVVRYLVPTFFLSPDASQPRLAWSLTHKDGQTVLSATNSGDGRIRLADLKIQTAGGRTVMVGKGLAGYTVPQGANAGLVIADSDHGPIRATLSR